VVVDYRKLAEEFGGRAESQPQEAPSIDYGRLLSNLVVQQKKLSRLHLLLKVNPYLQLLSRRQTSQYRLANTLLITANYSLLQPFKGWLTYPKVYLMPLSQFQELLLPEKHTNVAL
jgi:hypothetical protein